MILCHEAGRERVGRLAQRLHGCSPGFPKGNTICDEFDDVDHDTSEQTTQDNPASIGMCHSILLCKC